MKPASLREGLGLLRWGMAENEVLAAYPHAIPLPGYSGRNPITGKTEHVVGGFSIRSFVRLDSGATVSASTDADDQGRVVRIHLDLPQPTAVALKEMALWLGVGAVDSNLQEQKWTVDGCCVSLFHERGDALFTVYAP